MTKQVLHKIAGGLLGLAVIVGLTGTANAAGPRDNSWELGLFGSWVSFDSNAGIDDDIGFGGRAGYNITKNHEVELNYLMVAADEENGFGDVDLATWTIGYVYNWDLKNDKITPFATAAFGSTNTEVDITIPGLGSFSGEEDDTTILAGGGIRWNTSDLISIRFGADWIRIDADPDSVDNIDVNVGISFFVGGK